MKFGDESKENTRRTAGGPSRMDRGSRAWASIQAHPSRRGTGSRAHQYFLTAARPRIARRVGDPRRAPLHAAAAAAAATWSCRNRLSLHLGCNFSRPFEIACAQSLHVAARLRSTKRTRVAASGSGDARIAHGYLWKCPGGGVAAHPIRPMLIKRAPRKSMAVLLEHAWRRIPAARSTPAMTRRARRALMRSWPAAWPAPAGRACRRGGRAPGQGERICVANLLEQVQVGWPVAPPTTVLFLRAGSSINWLADDGEHRTPAAGRSLHRHREAR